MITYVIAIVQAILSLGNSYATVTVIPPMPRYAPTAHLPADNWGEVKAAFDDAIAWADFRDEAYDEYADEFTALFNSYECKWSKNGRLMMRAGDSGSYRFVAKGK